MKSMIKPEVREAIVQRYRDSGATMTTVGKEFGMHRTTVGDVLRSAGIQPRKIKKSTRERYQEKVDRGGPADCWQWTGSLDRHGYGRLRAEDGRFKGAHRLAYEFEVGPIPAGLCILHSCDVPACCNPAHLRPGTPKDNAADRDSRGRGLAKRRIGCKAPAARLRTRLKRPAPAQLGSKQVRAIAYLCWLNSGLDWVEFLGRGWKHWRSLNHCGPSAEAHLRWASENPWAFDQWVDGSDTFRVCLLPTARWPVVQVYRDGEWLLPTTVPAEAMIRFVYLAFRYRRHGGGGETLPLNNDRRSNPDLTPSAEKRRMSP